MNLLRLAWRYLSARPLNTVLNLILLGLGIAMITLLTILNKQLEENISKNARGIDLVVGAKGSPLQLILCNIFHIDFPTGNIPLIEAERIARNRLVKNAIPLALGDSYQGFRIIGTVPAYGQYYGAEVAEGKWFGEEMEVVLGARVAEALKWKVGKEFESVHGLSDGGHAHDEAKFVVTGILASTGTVVDNLILCDVPSIWHVHGAHETETTDSLATASKLIPGVSIQDSTTEITSMLIQYRSAMGAVQMPRWVNSQSNLQAASPAFEIARLFSILGTGIALLSAFAYILIFVSALSIFIALYNSMKERRYDIAIMRSMGSSRSKVFGLMIVEGVCLTTMGAAAGILLGHLLVAIASSFIPDGSALSATIFYPEEVQIFILALLLGVACSVLPAIQAYRTDISKTLSRQ